jgi:tRNA dimethylallyltransferase
MERVEQRQMVAVVGCTASGKSKLALDLAHHFISRSDPPPRHVVILSVDSMQVYRHVDVLSAKVSKADQSKVPHLLLDVTDVWNTSYSVAQFQKDASECLEAVWGRDPTALVIAVGGTHLWLEALLWPDLYAFTPLHQEDADAVDESAVESRWSDLTDVELHGQLLSRDPDRAKQLHPNARRKVLRSLLFLDRNNVLHSTYLAQKQAAASTAPSGGLRYQVSFVWVDCAIDTLNQRIDSRVDAMVNAGLEQEILFIVDTFRSRNLPLDYTKGALQSIGFKEFAAWLEQRHQKQQDEGALKSIFDAAVVKVKMESRKYAKKQIKWIKNHLVTRIAASQPSCALFKVNSLCATDQAAWDSRVIAPLAAAVTEFLAGKSFSVPHEGVEVELVNLDRVQATTASETLHCEVCGIVIQDARQMAAHVKGKPHKARKAKQSKQGLGRVGKESTSSRQESEPH